MDTNFKVFIKKCGQDFFDDWAFAAYVGFRNRGFILEQTLFFYEDIREVPARKTNIVIGPIEDTIEFFKRLNISVPLPLNIPKCLQNIKYLDRVLNFYCLKDLKTLSNSSFPLFIKSSEELKVFPSTVVKDKLDFDIVTKDVPDETECLICKPLNFVAEYRCFVNKRKLVGIKHYLGDFTVFPNVKLINECISVYTYAPVSYTIDFAITDESKTVLIECNDAWSIGHYGLDEKIYTTLLVDRWMEIMFGVNRS